MKVTVITPVYNAEDYLDRTINSIINQTFGFENIEYILVDDKSTDNSREIIEKYCEKYDNIKAIFLDVNSGFPGKGRNLAIQKATTDYLVFLDNDDYYLPEAIETYYNTIKKEDVDFLISSNYNKVGDNLIKVKCIDTDKKMINVNPTESQETFDLLSTSNIAPWAKIWKRKFVVDNGLHFPEDCLNEDLYFYVNALLKAKKVTVLPNDIYYVYDILDDSTIHTHTLKAFNSFFKGLKLTASSRSDNVSKDFPISENMCGLFLMFSNLSNEDRKIAMQDIYDFEKGLNHNIIINKKEINLLNRLIMNRNFTLASKLAGFYRFLYDNQKIKNLYRAYNNMKTNRKL